MAALQGHTVISTSPPKGNLEATTEVYNDRVQDALFGKTTIRNFKDTNNENATYLPESREKLLIFFTWFEKCKTRTKKGDPAFYRYCEEVWQVRNHHRPPSIMQGTVQM